MCSTSCKFRVDEGATYCQNRTCPTVTSGSFASEPHYSTLISLSDHTGGIDTVRLSGQPASDLLQQTVGRLEFSWLLLPSNNFSSCMAITKTPDTCLLRVSTLSKTLNTLHTIASWLSVHEWHRANRTEVQPSVGEVQSLLQGEDVCSYTGCMSVATSTGIYG